MKKLVTMFLAAVFLLVTFVPVSAADWNLYGSARVTTFWTDFDGDITQLNHGLQANSRIGGTVSHGAVKGGYELGIRGDVGAVYGRLLYGTVDLGFGEFLVGQHYSPLAIGSFISNQVYNTDNGLLQFVAYTNPGGRPGMGQLSVNGLKIALIRPMEFGDPEVLLPQLQASYDLKLDGVSLNFGGGFQTYDIDGGDGDSLTAYMVALNTRLTMLDPLYINFGGFYGQNVGNIGQSNHGGDWTGRAIIVAADDIEDTDTFAGVFVLGAKLDTIGVEAGVGYRVNDNDLWDDEQKVLALYLQANVPLSADGRAFIVPEVGMIDYEWGDLEFDETYFGLKWQVNF